MPLQRDRMAIPAAAEVVDYARRLGARRALLRAAYVLVNRAVPLSVFDCVRLAPEDVNDALAKPDGRFEGRFVDAGFFDRLASDRDAQVAIARGAFTRGDACWVVLDESRLANVSFYASGPTPLANDLAVHFDPRCRYMHGAYTPPAYRGQRLHALGVLRAARALFASGVPALVGVCERTNYRSMVSTLRMGWRRCGTLYRVGTKLGATAAARDIGMWLEARPPEEGA